MANELVKERKREEKGKKHEADIKGVDIGISVPSSILALNRAKVRSVHSRACPEVFQAWTATHYSWYRFYNI